MVPHKNNIYNSFYLIKVRGYSATNEWVLVITISKLLNYTHMQIYFDSRLF